MTAISGYRSVRFAHDAITVPGGVHALVNTVIGLVPELSASARDGLSRRSLHEVLRPEILLAGGSDAPVPGFGGGEIDFVLSTPGVAVTVQTRRASQENAALVALIAASSMPDVEWLIVAVPEMHAGRKIFSAVAAQFMALNATRGVSFALQGAFLIGF